MANMSTGESVHCSHRQCRSGLWWTALQVVYMNRLRMNSALRCVWNVDNSLDLGCLLPLKFFISREASQVIYIIDLTLSFIKMKCIQHLSVDSSIGANWIIHFFVFRL